MNVENLEMWEVQSWWEFLKWLLDVLARSIKATNSKRRVDLNLINNQIAANASGVSAKPAMRGHFKTGHVRWPGTDPFYPAFSCSSKSVLVLQLRGPHLGMWPWLSKRPSLSVTAARA